MNTRRVFAWLAVLSMAAFCLSAQAAPATPPFYLAQKGDITIYVLGTLHLGRADDYPLSDQVEQALKESRLVTELTEKDVREIPRLVGRYLCKTDCLREYMTEQQWQQLVKRGESHMARLPPWLYVAAGAVRDLSAAGLSMEMSTEAWLGKYYAPVAAENGEPAGLETAREQLDMFASFDKDTQRAMLQIQLQTSHKEQVLTGQRLYMLWRRGDTEGMYRFSKMQDRKWRQYAALQAHANQVMIDERNQRFLERLQPFLQPDKPVFMAVGALHLGGKAGVIELLRRQGYRVKKL